MTSSETGDFRVPFDGNQPGVGERERYEVSNDFRQLYENLIREYPTRREESYGNVRIRIPSAADMHWIVSLDAERDAAHHEEFLTVFGASKTSAANGAADTEHATAAGNLPYGVISLARHIGGIKRQCFDYVLCEDGATRRVDKGDALAMLALQHVFTAPEDIAWRLEQAQLSREIDIQAGRNYQLVSMAEIDDLYVLLTRSDAENIG